jgi:hypothetical protein
MRTFRIGKAILYPIDELDAWEKKKHGVLPCVWTMPVTESDQR